jgi:signal peptidase II
MSGDGICHPGRRRFSPQQAQLAGDPDFAAIRGYWSAVERRRRTENTDPSTSLGMTNLGESGFTAKPSNQDFRPWLLLLSLLIVVSDRLSKWLVAKKIDLGSAVTVIPHVFRISHVENQGAAFSLFDNSASPTRVRWMLLIFSLLAAFVILGGALGNAYDRLRFGFVVDFLEVHIIHYHWPDFNVADSAIVIGGLLLLLDAVRE